MTTIPEAIKRLIEDGLRDAQHSDEESERIESFGPIDGEPAWGVEMPNGDLFFITVEPA